MGTNHCTVTFWGAAQSVSGSMHLVDTGRSKILLDCGLHLGPRNQARERNTFFPFKPRELDAVVLSHAHIDHCGNIPNLIRQGYDGPIYCTDATRDLIAVMLADSARIQEEEAALARNIDIADDVNGNPLYGQREVDRAIRQCMRTEYNEPLTIADDVDLTLRDAGHLLGSAMCHLRIDDGGGDSSIGFTGDLGRSGLPFLHSPAPMPNADVILCEATYGGRRHQPLEQLADNLAAVVTRTLNRGGKVLIPAFSLGRAQVVVYYLQEWMEKRKMPKAPIYVDSGLAAAVAQIYQLHPKYLAPATLPRLEEAPRGSIQYVRSLAESKDLSRRPEPCIVVASGGMCEAGRILRHLRKHIDDPRCSIVLVSYQAPQSLGHRLRERGPTVMLSGKKLNKWAEVVDLNGFSGHADHDELLRQITPLSKHAKVRLVHCDVDNAALLAADLRARGFADVAIPSRGDVCRINTPSSVAS